MIHVIREPRTKNDWLALSHLQVLYPWGVFLHGKASFVFPYFAINSSLTVSIGTECSLLFSAQSIVIGSVEIVPVKTISGCLNLFPESITHWGLDVSVILGVEIVVTLVGLKIGQK